MTAILQTNLRCIFLHSNCCIFLEISFKFENILDNFVNDVFEYLSWMETFAVFIHIPFCEARRASHCHSPQTTFSSKSTGCVLSTQKSAMHVVVYADRLTTQHSIVDIVHWSWSYWQFCYPRWHVECFWAALAAHWIPTFGNRYLSAIGGGKQRSRLAGWVQLSAEAGKTPGPHGVPPAPPCAENCGTVDDNIDDAGNLHK